MIIDSHNHVNYQGVGTDALISEMDMLGIDQTWILTWYLPPDEDDLAYHKGTSPTHIRADGTHSAMPLSDIVAARQKYANRFIAGYCPCPTQGDAPALFEAAYHMHNVRVCGEWSYRMMLDDPRSLNLFHKAGELGCPVVIHIDVPYLPDKKAGKLEYQPRWYGGTIDSFCRAVEACPQTIFIGHAPGFWRYLGGDGMTNPDTYLKSPIGDENRSGVIDMFEKYPNLWADLSAGSGLFALQRDIEFTKKFITRYADRLLFGRDQHGKALMEFIDCLQLENKIKDKLLWENASRLLK